MSHVSTSTMETQFGYQFIYPFISFTCSKTITGWTFTGTNGNGMNAILPKLQVWRLVGSTFNLIGSSNGAGISVVPLSNGAAFYTLTMEPVTVQSGDMLGIFVLPATSYNGTISPYFHNIGMTPHVLLRPISSTDVEQSSISTSSIFALQNTGIYIIPLVSVIFGKHATSIGVSIVVSSSFSSPSTHTYQSIATSK